MLARQRRLEPGLRVRAVYHSRRMRAWRLALALGSWCAAAAAPVGAASSALPNPTATFATPGIKDVALTACNSHGCTTVHQLLTVLDPHPAVSAASISASTLESGQIARLTGAGSGQPPLSFSWLVQPVGLTPPPPSPPPGALAAASPYLDTTGFASGAYTAVLTIQNAAGSAQSLPVPFTVIASRPEGFYTVTPCRVFDSRQSGAPLASGVLQTINVAAAACGIPTTARAIAANFAVVSPTGPGVITLFPANYPTPATSNVNFAAGQNRSANGVLELATDGSGTLAAALYVTGNGTVHLILDVTGYFKP